MKNKLQGWAGKEEVERLVLRGWEIKVPQNEAFWAGMGMAEPRRWGKDGKEGQKEGWPVVLCSRSVMIGARTLKQS